jgi:hypothetical protein
VQRDGAECRTSEKEQKARTHSQALLSLFQTGL